MQVRSHLVLLFLLASASIAGVDPKVALDRSREALAQTKSDELRLEATARLAVASALNGDAAEFRRLTRLLPSETVSALQIELVTDYLANHAIEKAEELAADITRPSARVIAYRQLAFVKTLLGDERGAMSLADRVEGEEAKREVSNSCLIAKCVLEEMNPQALLNQLGLNGSRADEVLAVIARCSAERGSLNAGSIAAQIQDPARRAAAMVAIASEARKRSRQEDFNALLAKAYDSAYASDDLFERRCSLLPIASAKAAAGDIAGARDIMTTVEGPLRAAPDAHSPVLEDLFNEHLSLVKTEINLLAGDFDAAINSAGQRVGAITLIASYLARQGRSDDLATLEQAYNEPGLRSIIWAEAARSAVRSR